MFFELSFYFTSFIGWFSLQHQDYTFDTIVHEGVDFLGFIFFFQFQDRGNYWQYCTVQVVGCWGHKGQFDLSFFWSSGGVWFSI